MTTPVYGTDMMIGVGTRDAKLTHLHSQFASLLGKVMLLNLTWDDALGSHLDVKLKLGQCYESRQIQIYTGTNSLLSMSNPPEGRPGMSDVSPPVWNLRAVI